MLLIRSGEFIRLPQRLIGRHYGEGSLVAIGSVSGMTRIIERQAAGVPSKNAQTDDEKVIPTDIARRKKQP